ncbi:MAG: histidine kinase [Chitinophagaceae bacterium]
MKLKTLYTFLLLLAAVTGVQGQKENPLGFFTGQNQFRNNISFSLKDSFVCFFLRGHLAAKSVRVSGSFNNWTHNGIPFNKTDSGWVSYIQLNPGKHVYKFIIDGIWELDPDNFLTQIDGGYINNVYYKTNVNFILPGFNKAKKVFLEASSADSKPAGLQMMKTQNGWELPLYFEEGIYDYHFIVDGTAIPDPKNQARVSDENGNRNSIVYIGKQNDLWQAFHFYEKALTANNKNEIAVSLTNIGNIYYTRSDYSNALKNFQKALSIYQQLIKHDSTGFMYLKIGGVNFYLADLPAQLTNIQNAIKEFEEAKNEKGLAEATKRMGFYYQNMGEWPKATAYFEKAIILYQRLHNQVQLADMLHNAGHSSGFYDKPKSLDYLNKSLKLSEKIGYQDGIADNLWLLGYYYKDVVKEIPTAVTYFTKAMEIYEKIDRKGGIAEILLSFAGIYLEEPDSILQKLDISPSQKYSKAISNEKMSLQLYTDLKHTSRKQVVILFISQTYEAMGMYDSAFHYYQRWVDGQNKYFNTEKQKELTRIETEFKYYKTGDSLKLEKKITDEKLQRQLIVARQQQQQLELNQAELALSNKEKDLQHLAYLKMQSDLQNEQLIKKQNEKESQLQSVQLKSLTQDKAINKLNQQRQWIYIIAGFILLAMGSLYFIYRSRLRSVRLEAQLVKEKSALEKKETEFQYKLADISMSALRSQMNPHFIFNCLNSIKLYTTQNDTVAASEYLTKFSKLIRLVLENSRNERITLSSELAALELYIEMEAMRFKEKLSYSLVVEENVEASYIEIPPLLLQPYVENAIWHGLMAREEGGQIAITVAIKNDDTLLEIKIADNGIGRAAATLLKNKMGGKHKSYGMKATTERIALINQIYKTGANVFVHDLVDEDGQAAGTEVILQIPV